MTRNIPNLSSSDLNTLLSVGIQAATAAGKEIVAVYNSNDFQTQHKVDKSPVTIADRRAHDVISNYLGSTNLPVLSEEGKNIPYEERQHWKYFWMVDPLDGTKEFLKRNGEFTVNIALLKDNTPVLGIVTVPLTGEIYHATKGQGAFFRSNEHDVRLVERKSADLNQRGIRVVASRSHMNEATAQFIQKLNEPQLVTAGSSLKFIAVAKGEADIYPRYIPCMEWDTAAADVIVREVGLSILDAEHHIPLQYNKENLMNPFFICS
ncbi:MAG TPA: 3'(2'),5'-bisphosphate nucleotidase CysQ [Cyclobacteriaceae bacterium]|nr:3'(2'),5'-bisphosphate nucleotidase CysQ [Cyclobacteriaceae bacterium]